MHAGPLPIQNPGIQLCRLARCRAVSDDASKIAQATNALLHMLATEHLEDHIHTFASRQLMDGLLVILRFVVDGV